jgi:hypothetical protein
MKASYIDVSFVYCRKSPRFSQLTIQRQSVRNFRTKKKSETKIETESPKKDQYYEEFATNQKGDSRILQKYIVYAVLVSLISW